MKTIFTKLLSLTFILLVGTLNANGETPAAPTFTWDKSEILAAWTTTTGPQVIKDANGIKFQQIGSAATIGAYINISSANASLDLSLATAAALTITSATDYISSIVITYASSGSTKSSNPYVGYNTSPTAIGSTSTSTNGCEIGTTTTNTAISYAFTPTPGAKFAVIVCGATCGSSTSTTGQNRISHIDVYTTPNLASITSFTVNGQAAVIDQVNKTIKATLPYGTNLSAITPVVTLGGTATSYTPTGATNFSAGAVTYTATGGGASTNYAVTLTTVTSASSDATLSDLKVDGTTVAGFSAAILTYNVTLPFIYTGIPVISSTVNDITAGQVISQTSAIPGSATVTVTAQDNSVKVYTVNFTRTTASTACDITSFKINAKVGVITDPNIVVRMQLNTDVTSLTPTLVVSSLATYSPAGAQNFTNPVNYVVTAEDGTQKTYTVTVVLADMKFTGPFPYETNFPSGYVIPEWMSATVGSISFVEPYGAGTSGMDKGLWYDNVTETAAATASVIRASSATTIEFYVSNCTNITAGLSATGTRTFNLLVNGTVVTSLPSTAGYTLATLAYAVNATTPTIIGINATEATAFTLGYLKIDGQGTGLNLIKLPGVTFDGQIIHNENQLDLQVIDALGRLVIRSKENINMGTNPKGFYFVKSNSGTLKIVLTK